jgi:hypothetical protein
MYSVECSCLVKYLPVCIPKTYVLDKVIGNNTQYRLHFNFCEDLFERGGKRGINDSLGVGLRCPEKHVGSSNALQIAEVPANIMLIEECSHKVKIVRRQPMS